MASRLDSGARRFNSATAVMPWKPLPAREVAGAGRCFNSATAVMPWKPPPIDPATLPALLLQFGHGGDAVETPPSPPRVPPGGSFNSATAVMPWKLEVTVQVSDDEQ